jgi:hypothetical protein
MLVISTKYNLNFLILKRSFGCTAFRNYPKEKTYVYKKVMLLSKYEKRDAKTRISSWTSSDPQTIVWTCSNQITLPDKAANKDDKNNRNSPLVN